MWIRTCNQRRVMRAKKKAHGACGGGGPPVLVALSQRCADGALPRSRTIPQFHCHNPTSPLPSPSRPDPPSQKHKAAAKKAGVEDLSYPIHSAKGRPPKGLGPEEEEARGGLCGCSPRPSPACAGCCCCMRQQILCRSIYGPVSLEVVPILRWIVASDTALTPAS